MQIRILPESPIPIYTQLIYQIKKGIITSELLPSEGLPSVRVLAGDIGINMHTVNKAYKILVEEGVLVQQKKGFMVSPEPKVQMTSEFKELYQERLQQLLIDERIFSLTDVEIAGMRLEIEKKLKVSEENYEN